MTWTMAIVHASVFLCPLDLLRLLRNSLSSTFTTKAETLKGIVTKALNSRAKDNSTIYLEPVPNQATLNAVPGLGMVKPTPFVESTGEIEL